MLAIQTLPKINPVTNTSRTMKRWRLIAEAVRLSKFHFLQVPNFEILAGNVWCVRIWTELIGAKLKGNSGNWLEVWTQTTITWVRKWGVESIPIWYKCNVWSVPYFFWYKCNVWSVPYFFCKLWRYFLFLHSPHLSHFHLLCGGYVRTKVIFDSWWFKVDEVFHNHGE